MADVDFANGSRIFINESLYPCCLLFGQQARHCTIRAKSLVSFIWFIINQAAKKLARKCISHEYRTSKHISLS